MKAGKTQARKRPPAAPAAAPAPRPAARRWWWYGGALLALYAAFQAYGPVINGPFVFDDSYLPFRAPNFPSALKVWIAGVRPLLMASYWVNFQISPTDTLWYHIFNILFHVANSFLVFLIVRKILSYPGAQIGDAAAPPRVSSGRPVAPSPRLPVAALAAFAGGLFLLHPVQTESVSYVASRSETLSLLFFFAAFTIFLYRPAAAVTWQRGLAVLLLFGAAVTVKEHTVALIPLLLLTDYYWNPGFSFEGIKRNWRLYVPVMAGGILGGLVVWRVLARASTAGFALKDFTWYQYFFTQCRVFFVYLRLLLLPYGQRADYDFPISRGILEHGAIIGLIAIGLLAAAAIGLRRRYPLASYGFLAYILLLAPTSSFVPIQDPIAERRVYLAMTGILLVIADGVRRIPASPKTLAAALGSVLLAAGVLTYQRNRVWSSDVALWQDTVAKSPRKARARFQLAYAYQFGAGRCDLALPQYEEVARLQPPTYDLLVDWGEAYECVGRVDDSLVKLRAAAALEPRAHAYFEIGTVCARHKRYGEALEAFDMAEKLDPNYTMSYINRAGVYLQINDLRLAIATYRRALAIEPANTLALDGLAKAEARARTAQ